MRLFSILLFGLFALSATAQVKIQGQVLLEPTGEPAIGATVAVKGTTTGAITDFDGNYTIQVPDRKAILMVTYTGFVPAEVEVGNQNAITIRLSENLSQLDEIVVTGYGTQKRSSISGAVASINADDIKEKAVLRVEQALQGKVAGVQIAQVSGSPGSPLTVRIRGVGTINNSDPLYIVDGVPVDGLDFLNPADIEDVNILKDAASAAIYGSRGANGVVLITTKGGKRTPGGKISVESYYGVQRAGRLVDLLDAREWAMLQNEAYIAAGQTPKPELQYPDALGTGTNWQEAIFEIAPVSNQQLTISGANDRSGYTISGNYFKQDGIVGGPKAAFQRATARINGNHDVRSWLTMGSNMNFTWLERNGLIENSQYNSPVIRALNMDPVTPIRKADGTYAYSTYATTDIANPVNAIEQSYNQWRTNRLVGNVYADLKLNKNLTFRSAVSLDATFAISRGFAPKYDLSNIPTISEAPAQEKSTVNTVAVGNHMWRNWQVENVLTWHKMLSEAHDLTLIAGTTTLNQRYNGSGGANTNLPSNKWEDAYIGNTIDPKEAQSSWQGANESSMFSYFAKANYELNKSYLFSATFRADGSSRFGRNNRYGYFPSFSAGWVASHEDFWRSNIVNFLKIRASWGQNGNNNISDYAFSTVVRTGQNYAFGPDETITNGSVPLEASNPDLKWETSTQTDIGLDAEFFDSRVQFTTDLYLKKTSDMLYKAPIPLVAGTEPPVQNVATAENKGLELGLSYRNYDHPLRFSVGGNIAFVKNEVTGLGRGNVPVLTNVVQSAGGATNQASRTDVGHPIASFYGYVTDGIFQNQAEVEAAAFQTDFTAPGDIRFKDLDGNGIINENDRTYIGNPTPSATFGFTTDLSWRGFDLNVFFQGVQGNDIYVNTTRYDFSFVNRPSSALGRWTGEGTSNSEPRVSLSDPNQNTRISDRFIQDGSYLRLKTVQFGYNFPKNWLKKARLEKLRLYVTGQNLLTWTKFTGLDPDIGVIGSSLEIGTDRGFYPQPRTVLGGISLNF